MVKPDRKHKACCVAGGHITDLAQDQDVFAAMVQIANIHLAFLLVALNELDVLMGDIKNANLYAKTKRKCISLQEKNLE